jgi:cell cycle sensor histidine kinase DivJ
MAKRRPPALRVLNNIAGKAFSIAGNAHKRSETPRRSRRALSLAVRISAAGAASLFSLALMQLGGMPIAAMLPASAAIFAAALTLCLLIDELVPVRHIVAAIVQENKAPRASSPLDILPGLITRHDSAGNLVAVHGAEQAAFGLSPDRITPSAFIERVHVAGRIAFLSAIDDLRRGSAHASADLLFAANGFDGGYRAARVELSAEHNADGAFAGFLAQTRDRSAETAASAEASHWKDEALCANDAKTRFLAAVSHELRTPLNAILGFSDILVGEYFGRFENERQKEYVELINRSGKHLLAVVNAMLDMSKIEAGRYDLLKEHFRIADAISATEEMLALTARSKGVVITTRIARNIDEVYADRRAIQQVLINLANNAIKFTGESGVVAIDAARDNDNLVLTVSDTGIGIAADKLDRIGQPFMQADSTYARQFEGTGLGLALVKGLVALHGGSFNLTSEQGVGTRVTVTIPFDGSDETVHDTVEFPPRLQERTRQTITTGEIRHGAAQAKIA